jgi:Ca-activated chloride channel family protein
MPIHFYNPIVLAWLWLVPALAGLFIYAAIRRKRAIKAFGSGAVFISRKREAFSSCAAVALVILALARPAWDLQEQHLQETGRDVIFLLDVSRSMLAEDMHPNRLENAKTAILDCVESLSGDRVGLVLFAGSAEIRCPLTADYDYFRMALRQATPDSVTVGGTQIANAIEKVADKLIGAEKAGLQDLILITDGEDMIDGSDEVEAARLLDDAGARLIAIGIGDRTRGSRISVENEETGTLSFMKHDNREVWTKLHSETLRQMTASISDGVYFEVANGPFDLKQIYRQVMEHAERTSVEKQVMESYEEKFHLFLGGAVVVLLISNRWRRK